RFRTAVLRFFRLRAGFAGAPVEHGRHQVLIGGRARREELGLDPVLAQALGDARARHEPWHSVERLAQRRRRERKQIRADIETRRGDYVKLLRREAPLQPLDLLRPGPAALAPINLGEGHLRTATREFALEQVAAVVALDEQN